MSDFFSYLSYFRIALLLVALMSGLLSIFREALHVHNGRVNKKKERINERKLFWRSIWVAFIVSSIWLWCGEHSDNIALHHQIDQQAVPQLHVAIDGVMDSTIAATNGYHVPPHTRLLILTVRIANRGAPSIAMMGKVTVRLADGREVNTLQFVPPETNLYLPGAPGTPDIDLLPGDYLPRKSLTNPIPTGGVTFGWIPCILQDIQHGELDRSRVTVEFSDVAENVVRASREIKLNAGADMFLVPEK